MKKVLIGLMGLMGLMGLAGCKATKVIEQVPVYVRDTAYMAKEVHDSTFIDRWHTVYQQGDTVFDTKTITITKTLTRTDTAYKVVEKPVIVSKTETVEVERLLRWWQKGLMWMGLVGLVGLMGWIGIKVYVKR